MLKAYGDLRSGNCYKVALLLTQLELPHQWVHVDLLKRETRTAEFLAKNPNGKTPLLEISPEEYLPESNAILYYLADTSAYFPTDRLDRARVMQWLFFEQYSHEPYIATTRWMVKFRGWTATTHGAELAENHAQGYAALDVMERHLTSHDFFAAGRYTIADIALYAYTHLAHEGGFDMAKYPAIRKWLARVAGQPRHVAMAGA